MKVITIGRGSENEVTISDDKVSKHHAQIIQADNGNFSIVDLNSTNKTFVNGHEIVRETPLKATDIVRIGNTILPWNTYFK